MAERWELRPPHKNYISYRPKSNLHDIYNQCRNLVSSAPVFLTFTFISFANEPNLTNLSYIDLRWQNHTFSVDMYDRHYRNNIYHFTY